MWYRLSAAVAVALLVLSISAQNIFAQAPVAVLFPGTSAGSINTLPPAPPPGPLSDDLLISNTLGQVENMDNFCAQRTAIEIMTAWDEQNAQTWLKTASDALSRAKTLYGNSASNAASLAAAQATYDSAKALADFAGKALQTQQNIATSACGGAGDRRANNNCGVYGLAGIDADHDKGPISGGDFCSFAFCPYKPVTIRTNDCACTVNPDSGCGGGYTIPLTPPAPLAANPAATQTLLTQLGFPTQPNASPVVASVPIAPPPVAPPVVAPPPIAGPVIVPVPIPIPHGPPPHIDTRHLPPAGKNICNNTTTSNGQQPTSNSQQPSKPKVLCDVKAGGGTAPAQPSSPSIAGQAAATPSSGGSHAASSGAAAAGNTAGSGHVTLLQHPLGAPATANDVAMKSANAGEQASTSNSQTTSSTSKSGSGTHGQITLRQTTYGQKPSTNGGTTQKTAALTQSGQHPGTSGTNATLKRTSGYGKSVGRRAAPRQAARRTPRRSTTYRPARVASAAHPVRPAAHVTTRHRSDIRLKDDIVALGRLDNGIGLYRFRYKGSDHTVYVGVMAQEVQTIVPSAVSRGRDGYLRVDYDRLGLQFMTWDLWQQQQHGAPRQAMP